MLWNAVFCIWHCYCIHAHSICVYMHKTTQDQGSQYARTDERGELQTPPCTEEILAVNSFLGKENYSSLGCELCRFPMF